MTRHQRPFLHQSASDEIGYAPLVGVNNGNGPHKDFASVTLHDEEDNPKLPLSTMNLGPI